jgi:hypothetical protein
MMSAGRRGGALAFLLSIAALAGAGCHRGESVAPSTAEASPSPLAAPSTAGDPVPGMKRAERGEPCSESEYFIFAISSDGQTLACLGAPGHYELSAPVIGERVPGTECNEEGLAQSPDGTPLLCLVAQGSRRWDTYNDY